MRRGKRYQAWIAKKSQKSGKSMIKAAAKVIEYQKQKIAFFIEEVDKEDKLARETVAYYQRTILVIEAFLKIGPAEDRWQIIDEFSKRIKLLEKGLKTRQKSKEYLRQKQWAPTEVVEASVTGDLRKLWDKYQEGANDEISSSL
jgi:hypothetical protein